ncbi:MAG: hypothetical protein QXR35_07185, partial [Candidatus Korarchaeum sp.]
MVKIISGASDSLPIYDPTTPFFSGKISPRLLTHHSIPMLKLRERASIDKGEFRVVQCDETTFIHREDGPSRNEEGKMVL